MLSFRRQTSNKTERLRNFFLIHSDFLASVVATECSVQISKLAVAVFCESFALYA